MTKEAQETEPEYILSAAIQFESAVYKGDGSHEAIKESFDLARGEEGFWTSKQRFVGRKKAFKIAEENGQLVPGTKSEETKTLHSADFFSREVLEMRKMEA